MASVADSKQLVDHILRLRRAERIPAVAAEISPVRGDLESQLGSTLTRSRTARILGVSQTALDRWISSGEIPTVITPRGRVEVPRQFLVEIAELIDELKRSGELRHPLAAALRRRREDAERVGRSLRSQDRTRGRRMRRLSDHQTAERRSLAYHRLVADRLDEELVREARHRIRALLDNGHLDPRYAERWQQLLARPIPEIAKTISSDTQRARDLRQNTPFAGVLNEQERRQIIENVR